MLCDVCKCNDASVFLTQILEGKMQKVNLCDACSKEKGVQDPTGFALADLLLGIGAPVWLLAPKLRGANCLLRPLSSRGLLSRSVNRT